MASEMLLQRYLRNGGTPEELEAKYAIKWKRHNEWPHLIMFKYNQIDSPFKEPIVQECRGVILDSATNWNVVCRSFDKFFNHGEQLAAPIDWTTARVEEKLDGSLCQLYFYGGKWNVASSGVPDASGNVMSTQLQGTELFSEIFWKTWELCGYKLPEDRHRHFTFSFELMTPQNRVLIPRSDYDLVLLGVRNNDNGVQYHTYTWKKLYSVVRTFPFRSLEACQEVLKTMDGMKQEGFVVVDSKWNRIKMKCEDYVAKSHIKDTACGPKAVLEVVRKNESTEFLTYFPEWKPTFDDVRARYEALVHELARDYARLADIPVQKDFALEAVKTRCSSCLFQLRNGRTKSIKEFLAGMQIKSLAQLLSIKDDEEKKEEAE